MADIQLGQVWEDQYITRLNSWRVFSQWKVRIVKLNEKSVRVWHDDYGSYRMERRHFERGRMKLINQSKEALHND
jgi:hypothetical protein